MNVKVNKYYTRLAGCVQVFREILLYLKMFKFTLKMTAHLLSGEGRHLYVAMDVPYITYYFMYTIF